MSANRHTPTDTHSQTDTQTDILTDRQSESDTHTHTDRQTAHQRKALSWLFTTCPLDGVTVDGKFIIASSHGQVGIIIIIIMIVIIIIIMIIIIIIIMITIIKIKIIILIITIIMIIILITRALREFIIPLKKRPNTISLHPPHPRSLSPLLLFFLQTFFPFQ